MLALLPIAAVAGLAYAAVASPLLTAQHIDVEGTQTLDQSALIDISGLKGKSMLDLPTDAATQRLLQVPAVQSVAISRTWPQTVTITITERTPVAYWSVNGRDYVVDIDGVVLSSGVPADPAPRIVEPNSTRVLAAGDRVHPDAIALALRITQESTSVLGKKIESLEYTNGIGVTAVFQGGMRVTFGDERSYDYKMAVLDSLMSDLTAQGITPHTVDLRFGERVTYD